MPSPILDRISDWTKSSSRFAGRPVDSLLHPVSASNRNHDQKKVGLFETSSGFKLIIKPRAFHHKPEIEKAAEEYFYFPYPNLGLSVKIIGVTGKANPQPSL
jgi:hypothetical protein